jgi:hypothetical protein
MVPLTTIHYLSKTQNSAQWGIIISPPIYVFPGVRGTWQLFEMRSERTYQEHSFAMPGYLRPGCA